MISLFILVIQCYGTQSRTLRLSSRLYRTGRVGDITKDRIELLDLLNHNSIACGQLSSVGDLSEHEFLRNFEARFAQTSISMADLPVQTDAARPANVPLLNQHGDSVRAEFTRQEKN